jgi:hypothetical protein
MDFLKRFMGTKNRHLAYDTFLTEINKFSFEEFWIDKVYENKEPTVNCVV